MNSGEMIIRPIEADDARAVLRLVRQDFARVGQAADIEGLGYEEPTDEDIASLEAAVTDPKQPYQRAGAFDTDDHLVTYAKYGRLHPKDVVPYFGTCAALALASKGWYRNKTGLFTLATDGQALTSEAVDALISRTHLFTTQEAYIPSMQGDEAMAEWLASKGATRTQFLGETAIRNVTRPTRLVTTELWRYDPRRQDA